MALLTRIKDRMRSAWNASSHGIGKEQLHRSRIGVLQGYIFVILVLFSILAFFASQTAYFSVDLWLARGVQKDIPPIIGSILASISWFGYTIQSVVTVSIIFLILMMMRLRWEAISVVFAAVVSLTVNYLIKIVIQRPRPSADLVHVIQVLSSYSFPSGHVMFYFTFFGLLFFFLFTQRQHSLWRITLLIFLAVPILTVGLSRIYLGEHWASDVLGGYMVGSLTLIISIKSYTWGKDRCRISSQLHRQEKFTNNEHHPDSYTP